MNRWIEFHIRLTPLAKRNLRAAVSWFFGLFRCWAAPR